MVRDAFTPPGPVLGRPSWELFPWKALGLTEVRGRLPFSVKGPSAPIPGVSGQTV